MTALNFLTSGGMANLGGDLPDSERSPYNELAKEFANAVKQLAFANGIPAASLSVASAQFMFAGKTASSAQFVFAVTPGGGTKLHYQDLTKYGHLQLEQMVNDVKMNIGDPVFAFEVPLSELSTKSNHHALAESAALEYIGGLLKQNQKHNEDSGEIDSKLCFVIMSFSNNPSLQDFYEMAIKPTVETLGYRCERVDEQEFNGSIKDKILSNIRKAKFIIADVTEARPNCYYELGVAHALGKDVIHIANTSDDIHFDVNDFNFIIYSRLSELKDRLTKRIESTV